jgi:RNA-directed DNA polymerase
LIKLQKELMDKTYRHGKYRQFIVYEPKKRYISAPPFRDRVVHHAVCDFIGPFIDKGFIYDSYACRQAKGTHKAVDRAQGFLRANRFCLHGDIRQYFQSISHGILKEIIVQRVKDRDLLWLIDEIIDSMPETAPLSTGVDSRAGLPIGNLSSQLFANLYLNELDYFVKFKLKIRYYLRYMDDFLIYGNSRQGLLEIKGIIRDFLNKRLALGLHEGKSQAYRTCDGVKFLGFRIFKYHRRLASDNVRRFRKRLKKFSAKQHSDMKANDKNSIINSIRGWTAHSRHADCFTLRNNILQDISNKDKYFGDLIKSALVE